MGHSNPTTLSEALKEIERLNSSIALAYGFLFLINSEPLAPVPLFSPERASYEARKVLLAAMSKEQQRNGIEAAKLARGTS